MPRFPDDASNPNPMDFDPDAITNFNRDATADYSPHAGATNPNATDFDRGAITDFDRDGTTGPDRDATANHDPDATDGFVRSPGVPAANTEEASRSTGGRKGDRLPRIAGYEIQGVLGAGGMGIVYKARHLRLDRLVALKMIKAGAGTSGRPGPLRGRGPRGRCHRPSEHRQDLRDRRTRRPALLLAGVPCRRQPGGADRRQTATHRGRGARIAETLARAMDVAHRRGIVHRDIKPANVLLAGDGTPKIADFGLVKRLEGGSAQTGTGWILGSPSYMAPEQTTGAEKAGPAADQYALGATLYEMLTGRPPFRGSSILETLDLIRTAEPVAPSQLLPRIPRDLETICLKALQKDPDRRYSDVAAMADDLCRFRAGEPIVARPISGPERAWLVPA